MRKPQITHARVRLVAHIHGYISINYTSTGPGLWEIRHQGYNARPFPVS